MWSTRLRLSLLAMLLPAAALAEEDFLPAGPLHEAGLAKYWQLQLPVEGRQHVQGVFLVEDQLFVCTDDGFVFAVHAPTGVLRWFRPITRSGYPVRRPCRAEERVIFVTPGDVQVYDWRTGEPVIRHDLRFPAGSAGASDGKTVYVGGLDRRLYAIDLKTGFITWRATVDNPIVAPPARHGDLLYVATDAGSVLACTSEDKRMRWQATVHEFVQGELVVTDAGVYVPSGDFSLYLLDLNYGAQRWRARLSGPLFEAPVVTAELVYQYCAADGLVAIEPAAMGVIRDRVRWKLPAGRTFLAADKGRAYVLTRDDSVAVVNMADGAVIAAVPAAGMTFGVAGLETTSAYLGAPDGRLFCARPVGVPPLQRADVLAALGASGAESDAAAAGAQPTKRPAAGAEDRLRTKREGSLTGGRSKVTREFRPGGESN